MPVYPTNQAITLHFRHYDGTTGLVQADFTASLLHNGVAASESFTIAEIGSGFYSFTFTPENEGIYFADVVKTADNTARYQEEIQVENDLSICRKYLANNLVKDAGTNTVTIYDDDEVTDIANYHSTPTERTRLS